MFESVRAIAFDLDNTLWDVEPVIDRAEQRVLAWLHEHGPRIAERFSLAQMREARAQLATQEPDRAHDLSYLRRETLARQALACGYAPAVADRAFEIFLAARNALDPFRDVRPALERLHDRFVLASLSNGNADLNCIGLAQWFTVSLNAGQIGVAKPHPRAFATLTAELCLEPQHILYVGDDPLVDVQGARAAGLHVAWINRRGAPWPADVAAPGLVVRDCAALADILLARS